MPNQLPGPVLVLPSWYPSKLSPLPGDFLQRHVKATSLFVPQYVIHVIKDEEGTLTRDVMEEVMNNGNYTEKIIYYHIRPSGIRLVDRVRSHAKYLSLYRRAIREYIREHGKPALIHVHIALKSGLLALWAKKKWGIPFIVSEQWTVYLTETDYRVDDFTALQKQQVRTIFSEAQFVTTVSKYLGEAIKKRYPWVSYQVIPNVVDHDLFKKKAAFHQQATRFMHISTMHFQKNVEDTLSAFKMLKDRGVDFVFQLYGPTPSIIRETVTRLDLAPQVQLMGAVDQATLANAMQDADALVLYSRFETFGCVIIEANAVGLPVIVSDIPVFHELITENLNGIFVKSESPEMLAEKLQDFIQRKNNFDGEAIAGSTAKYSYQQVGRQFFQLYKKLFNITE